MNSRMFFLFLFTINAFSSVEDVKPHNIKKGDLYVRITKSPYADHVTFEKCKFGQEDTDCTYLGAQDSYSLDNLRQQRLIERAEVGGAIIGDIGAAAVITYGSLYALASAAIFSTGLSGAVAGISVSTGTGITGSVILAKSVDALNPVKQYKQSQTVSKKVILDRNFEVENIEQFIENLETVLNKV